MKMISFLFCLTCVATATAQEIGFYEGRYQLIGRFPDSDKMYSGTVLMTAQGDSLEIVRIIAGKESRGIGWISHVTADKIRALRVVWMEKGKRREIVYQINVDWDNYARLTGRYGFDEHTDKPGYEALFYSEP